MSEKTVSTVRLIFVSLCNEQVGKQTITLRIILKRRSMTPSNIAILLKFFTPIFFLSQMKEHDSKPLNPNFQPFLVCFSKVMKQTLNEFAEKKN